MNPKEVLNAVKDLVGLSKAEEIKDVEVTDEVVLSTEKEVEASVELADEVVKEEPKKEVEQVQVSFATQEELSQVKQELLSMIKALIEDKSYGADADVPEKLSKVDEVKEDSVEVELAEEIVHSPEVKTEQKAKSFINNAPMTTEQRVAWALSQ